MCCLNVSGHCKFILGMVEWIVVHLSVCQCVYECRSQQQQRSSVATIIIVVGGDCLQNGGILRQLWLTPQEHGREQQLAIAFRTGVPFSFATIT